MTAFEKHVVVDVRLADASGIGTYIGSVVPRVARLAPEWRFTLIADRRDGRTPAWADLPNVRVTRTSAAIFTLREQLALPTLAPRGADLFWATHYNFPALHPGRVVITIHDVGHLRLPEYANSLVKRGYARLMFGMARRRASALMFDSEFTRNEFDLLVGDSTQRGVVVHLGVEPSWFEQPKDVSPLGGPYFVYVGNVKPHKDLHTLLTAFDSVRRRVDAKLVLIGRSERFRTSDPSVDARAARLPGVVRLGETDGATVRRHVRHAIALILPSVYEGFGFPPLEAMAAGCPAIVSRAASLPEVCGDAALYFEPRDASGLEQGMYRIATDAQLRADLIARGQAQARRFDWDATARRVHEVLRRVVAA